MPEPITVTLPYERTTKGSILFQDQSRTDTALSNVYVRKQFVPKDAKSVKVTIEFIE